jgi:hypothetical protein
LLVEQGIDALNLSGKRSEFAALLSDLLVYRIDFVLNL